MGLDEIRKLKQEAKEPKKKKYYRIPPKSQKKIQQENESKISGADQKLENWFIDRRADLTGYCQCGCGEPSQKDDDKFYKGCCCHIFPKSLFKSVMYHPMNYVERRMFGGCHSNMDNRSIFLWPNMQDWEDIKRKYYILEPLLTEKERKKKFYRLFKEIVAKN